MQEESCLNRIGEKSVVSVQIIVRMKMRTPIKQDERRGKAQQILHSAIQERSPPEEKLAQAEEQKLALEEDGKTAVASGMLQVTATVVNISGDSSGPFANDDLDIADGISAKSMNG